jgi:hypothetical protein
MARRIFLTILGEPASLKNSRKLVTFGNRPGFIKSDKAQSYERSALLQIPASARQRLTGPIKVTMKIYYASERPDLDESAILDILQDQWGRSKPKNPIIPDKRILLYEGVYCNDRQVREKHITHGIDRKNPRAEIEIEQIDEQRELI